MTEMSPDNIATHNFVLRFFALSLRVLLKICKLKDVPLATNIVKIILSAFIRIKSRDWSMHFGKQNTLTQEMFLFLKRRYLNLKHVALNKNAPTHNLCNDCTKTKYVPCHVVIPGHTIAGLQASFWSPHPSLTNSFPFKFYLCFLSLSRGRQFASKCRA